MAANFAAARVREMTFATQGFLFFAMANAYRVFAYEGMGSGGGRSLMVYLHVLIIFSPFILARITPLMGVLPALLLRDEARVSLDQRGVLYQFDSVKRPLFVPWDQVAVLKRTRFGLVLTARSGADLFEGMPKFQGEFWRGKTRRPIRLQYVDRFAPEDGLWLALAAGRRGGADITGFGEPAASAPKTPRTVG